MDILEQIKNALAGVFYIATSEDNQPHVRPFDGAAIVDGKLYLGTDNTKKVYAQIVKNPKVEIFSMENGFTRFTAEAYPVEDAAKNKEIFSALGKDYVDNSAALELRNGQGILQDSMGDKKEFTF